MTSHVATVAFRGIEAMPVDVQVQLSAGNVVFNVVGLPDKAVGESRERVRAALYAVGLALPAQAPDRQSVARRSAQGRQPLRSADRAWRAQRHGHRARRFRAALCGARRIVARRLDHRGGGRAAGGDGRQWPRSRPHLPQSLWCRSGLGGRGCRYPGARQPSCN